MIDEQLGRGWCERNNLRPELQASGLYFWWTDDDPDAAGVHGLPEPIWSACNGYTSEAEAYDAVGAALRRVLALAHDVGPLVVGGMSRTHRTTGRRLILLAVEVPTRAELLRDGNLDYAGWQFGQSAIYTWQGRQWSVSPRRGRPKLNTKECEEVAEWAEVPT